MVFKRDGSFSLPEVFLLRYTRRPLAVLLLVLCASAIGAQSTDWPYYAGDAFSRRHTPAQQVDRTNFDRLSIAWRYTPPDRAIAESGARGYDNNRGTPLKVGDVLVQIGEIVARKPLRPVHRRERHRRSVDLRGALVKLETGERMTKAAIDSIPDQIGRAHV